VLADTHQNISEAARRLGITRRTLQLKLKKYPPRA
jgi:two-component system response regulator RegA